MNIKSIFFNLFAALISPYLGILEALRLRRFQLKTDPAAKEVWIFEAVPVFAFIYRYYYYIKVSAEQGHGFWVLWMNTSLFFRANRHSFKSRFMDRLTHNRYTAWKWKIIYKALCPGQWQTLASLKISAGQKAEALKILSSLESKKQLEEIKVNGLWAGDLIYDTYLRFKPAPTVNLQDPFLLELIEISISAIQYLEIFFKEQKITRVITTYSTYIHHGFLVRLALKYKVKIHVISDDGQLISEPVESFPYHTRNITLYRKWFEEVQDKTAALKIGKEMLDKRLSGLVDAATSGYMKKSSFHVEDDQALSKYSLDSRPKVIFMVHDFYDSPHVFGEMLYPDFYDWIENCCKFAENSPFQFIVKPHPNSNHESDAVFAEFKKRFPKVVFLEKKTSNALIAKLPIHAVVTVYGTAAHEFAMLNHLVLCLGENPHSSYNFSYRVETKGELEEILLGKKEVKVNIDLQQIYEFMYVHHYRSLFESKEFSVFIEREDCLKLLTENNEKVSRAMAAEMKRINLL